jgi:hypothetical protein
MRKTIRERLAAFVPKSRKGLAAGAIAGAVLIAGGTTIAAAQAAPPVNPFPGTQLVNVVKHYDPSDPRLQPPTFAGHIYETIACPTGKHAFNGGVRITEPDSTAPPDVYPGNAQQVYGDQWTIETSGGRFVGLPRPVDGDNAWRIPVALSLAYTTNPATAYGVNVTYYVVCG